MGREGTRALVQTGRGDDGRWPGGMAAGQKITGKKRRTKWKVLRGERAKALVPRNHGLGDVPEEELLPSFLLRAFGHDVLRTQDQGAPCRAAPARVQLPSAGPWSTLPGCSSPGSFLRRGPRREPSLEATSPRCPAAGAAHGRAAVCRRRSSCSGRATAALARFDSHTNRDKPEKASEPVRETTPLILQITTRGERWCGTG